MARSLPFLGVLLFLAIGTAQAGETAATPAAGTSRDVSQGVPPVGPGTSDIPLPPTWQESYLGSEKKEKSYIKGPNVHRSPLYCITCHQEGTPPSAGNLLYGGKDIPLCRSCHPRSVYRVHVVGVRPKQVKVPEEFPLPDGKLTCVSCHDEPSCNPPDSPSSKRPYFLRGTRTGYRFCFSCHEAKGYSAYNPHDPKHLGSVEERKNNCLFCHTAELPVDSRRGLSFSALKGRPNDLCSACHLEEPHFGIPAHLGVRDREVLARLAATAKAAGPRLPLADDGTPLCVSCHDPHMPGLLGEETAGSDIWMESPASALRREYLDRRLDPYVMKRVAELEAEYGRALIIREPGLFHREKRKLLRKGFREGGSLCLGCHDVFQEGKGNAQSSPFGNRMLH